MSAVVAAFRALTQVQLGAAVLFLQECTPQLARELARRPVLGRSHARQNASKKRYAAPQRHNGTIKQLLLSL